MAVHQYALDIAPVNAQNAMTAFRQGSQDRQAGEAETRNANLRAALPGYLAGDQSQAGAVMANADPEQQIQLHQMNAQQQAAHLEQVGAILANVKDQPSLDAAKAAYLKLPGTSPAEVQNITLQDIPTIIAQSQKAQAMLAQQRTTEMQGKEFALRSRVGEANIRQSDAAAAKDRAAATGSSSNIGPDLSGVPGWKMRAAQRYNIDGTLPSLGMGGSVKQDKEDILTIADVLAGREGKTGKDLAAGILDYKATGHGLNALAGRTANVETAANEVRGFADTALAASTKVGRGKFVPLSQVIQMGESAMSDPNLRKFKTESLKLANAAAVLAGRGTPNEPLQREYLQMLSTQPDAASYKATVDSIIDEATTLNQSTDEVRQRLLSRITGGNAKQPGAADQPVDWKVDASGNLVKAR